jgi:hypothetical protein
MYVTFHILQPVTGGIQFADGSQPPHACDICCATSVLISFNIMTLMGVIYIVLCAQIENEFLLVYVYIYIFPTRHLINRILYYLTEKLCK